MRKSILPVALLAVAAVLVAIQLRTVKPAGAPETELQNKIKNETETVTETETATEPETENGNLKTENSTGAVPGAGSEFQNWLRSEAQQMDAPSTNSGLKERQMREVASRLTQAQSRQLLETVRSPKAPAGEKILSTYLLVQAGPRAVQELRELIASPVAAPGEAHSEQEMNSMRDKTLRIMALDGLSARAKDDPRAREALAKAIEEIQDPYVKRYAQERLSRLQR